MTTFRDAFILLVDGSDPAERVHRESAMTRSTFVPVPDVPAAAAVAGELLHNGIELIELYGGLGSAGAAAVIEATGGSVPVGLANAGRDDGIRHRAAIYEAPGAGPGIDRNVFDHGAGRVTLVGVGDASQLATTASGLVEEGVEAIELCGGFGPVPAAALSEALDDRIQIDAVLFGFESLPGAAAYRARFEAAYAAL